MKDWKKGLFLFLLLALLVYSIPVFSEEKEPVDNNSEEKIVIPNNSEQEETKEKEESEEKEIITDNEKEEKKTTANNTKNEKTISVTYQTHIEGIGWQSYVKDGETSGTSHQSKRLEGIRIKIENSKYKGDIEYSTHVQDIGWQDYVKNGAMAGTSGQAKRLEAIQIRLTGDLEKNYDIYYRVHAENFGWLDWAKNGEKAGTSSYAYRLEAIEIRIVEKGTATTLKTTQAFMRPYITYQTHVESIGWQGKVFDGDISGTSGKALRLEGIKIALKNPEHTGNVEYRTFVEDIGWQNFVKNGEMAGTSGQAKRLEAIQIKLTGDIANYYDIYYRVHSQEFGWLDWAKNGESAGTGGYSYRLEAIEIKMVQKGQSAPGKTDKPYIRRLIRYKAYQNNKWTDYKYDGGILGTYGQPLESIRISSLKTEFPGTVSYSTYTTEEGWQKVILQEQMSNKKGSKIEAIKINISGEIANHYDIYYSTYISNTGWTGWAKNNEPCGNIGYGNHIQALKIQLVPKNGSLPGNTANAFKEDILRVKYTSYVEKTKWQSYVSNAATSGTTGQAKSIQGLKIYINKKVAEGDIHYSAHVSEVGWQSYVSSNAQAGVVGKKIEAVRIKLTGEIASKYDIYYRVHVSEVGWMGWAKNGENAGTSKAGLGVEAIQIQLVEKGKEAPKNTDNLNTDKAYLSARWEKDSNGNQYYYDIYGNMLKGGKFIIGNTTYYFSPTGIYLGNKNLEVIDVSAHNGVIDWEKVSKSGIYGAILRISASAVYEDTKLAANIEGVKKYHIPYGIYIYSYAESYTEGVSYGNFTKNMISKYDMNPTLGIFFDLESNSITQFMGPTEYTAVVKGYLSVIPNAELYTYVSYANTALNTSFMRNRITWIAHYNSYCAYTGSYKMWQYTSTGRVSGVSGDVDKSILYR